MVGRLRPALPRNQTRRAAAAAARTGVRQHPSDHPIRDDPVANGPIAGGPVDSGPVAGGAISGEPVAGGSVAGAPVDWAAVRRAYEAGAETVAAIARRFRLSQPKIRRRREAEGWPPRRSGPQARADAAQPLTAVDWAAVRQRYEAGERPIPAILAEFGITGYALTKRRESEGWTLRAPGARAAGRRAGDPHGRQLAAQLLGVVDAALAQLQGRAAAGGRLSLQDARMLGELARIMERTMRPKTKAGSAAGGRGDRKRKAEAADAADLEAADVEWMRAELKARLARLAASAGRAGSARGDDGG